MNKPWEKVIISQCQDCRFFATIRGVREIRFGCVVGVPRYQNLSRRTPRAIFVMEIIETEGRDGLAKILEKGNPIDRACGMFLPRSEVSYSKTWRSTG